MQPILDKYLVCGKFSQFGEGENVEKWSAT